ncbi:MAG: PorP/SprF family type IX secretion system membrane protein [Bacteroidetes bacterium]|nr:PorP/SprF family type IX secretion system membrane protein [Bacteroidota bacterium]
MRNTKTIPIFTAKRIGFLFLILFSLIGKAQDATYSQFNLNQLYYNPAYTGYQYGYQFSATYRTLWPNVRGKKLPGPLSTYHAWFDGFVNLPRGMYLGLGAFAMQDVEGEGFLTTTSAGVSFAAHFPKIQAVGDESPRIKISLGAKVYFNSISIDWDRLVFTDQLNIDYGITGSSAFGHTGSFRKNYPDFDIGLLLLNNFMGKDKWYNEFGFSVAHILSPSISLTGSTEDRTRLPQKFIVSYRSTVNLVGGKLFVGPTILFENQGSFFRKQGDFYELNAGLDFFVRPSTKSYVVPLTVSVMNRLSIVQGKINTSAIILGITHKGVFGKKSNSPVYYVGAAVDFPYMGLGMQSAGAYELSIGIIIPPKHTNGYSKCPMGTFDHSGYFNSNPFMRRKK